MRSAIALDPENIHGTGCHVYQRGSDYVCDLFFIKSKQLLCNTSDLTLFPVTLSLQVVRHTLRHTAITHLVQAGIDLPTVKRISGHKTLHMVERYSHQNGAHIQAAMDKLEKRYNLSTALPRMQGLEN